MKICLKCGFENKIDSAESCEKCGSLLAENAGQVNVPASAQDDELDFVVTETTGGDAPDFLTSGSDKPNKTDSKNDGPDSDKLEITANANLLEDSDIAGPDQHRQDIDSGPIGDSSPSLIPFDYQRDQMADSQMPKRQQPPEDEKQLSALSQEEVVNIRKKLYGPNGDPGRKQKHPGIDKPEKPELAGQPDEITIESTSHPPNSMRPINDPAKIPGIEKAGKVRGVAYFKKNFIQLAGNPALHSGDEITINDKPYLLKPKRLSRKVTIGVFAASLIILLTIVGAQFISPTVSGSGEIIGMILDTNGEPYLEGARVSIRSLNKTVISNPQGFFRFDMIPTGTYQIAFDLGGVYAGTGNVTVTAGQTTLTSFGRSEVEFTGEGTTPVAADRQSQKASKPLAEVSKPATQQKSSKPSQNESSKKSDKKSSDGYGKVELKVNLDDARFSVDDEVLGAGSNTFSKIQSGNRTIKVSKPGYVEYAEQVDIGKNETVTINVTLERDEKLSKESLSAEEWINLGDDMQSSGKYQRAIKDYSNAISRSPGMIAAYQKRADLYASTGDKSNAVGDYIRIGEIYRVKGKPANAVSAFRTALEINPNNKIALAGRGGAWMDQGDYRPALVDFDAALEQDSKFYPALYGAGVCDFKMGDYKKADKYFKNAHKIKKDDPYLYQYMMLNYLAKDDITKVRKIYSEFKDNTSAKDLAEFKSSPKNEPILRLINEEDR